jgi:tetratricopeptide (TPR) repeat protein
MTETASKDPQSGGVNIAGATVATLGDIVGRDQITQHITAFTSEKVTALHQLPPPPADFTGRADDLDSLIQAIRENHARILGIFGMGGLGKTALALKLADHLKEDYPDGQIYLDLKGVSAEPLPPAGVMAHVIRSFDLTAKPPNNETELTALYRSVLHGKKVLLLMDNVANAKQLESLIPFSTCLLLVTSRFHFTIPGLLDRNLDKLTTEDATALLLRIAPRLNQEKPEIVSDLVRLSGSLPLALRSLASVLHEKKNLSATKFILSLADARERLKRSEVDAPLILSYQLLPQDLQEGFRTLSIFPNTFGVDAVAAIWETQLGVAEDRLAELLKYSLVDFNETTGRYRLHDLVRLFADLCLGKKERGIAQKRHAEYFFNIIESVQKLYDAGGQSLIEGLTTLDAEWENIKVGQAWAAARANYNEAAAQLCIGYAMRGTPMLALRQQPIEMIGWLQQALSAIGRQEDPEWKSAALGNIGNAYVVGGNDEQGIQYLESALAIARASQNKKNEAKLLISLSIVLRRRQEYVRAIEYIRDAIGILAGVNDQQALEKAFTSLGNVYYAIGEYDHAIEYLQQALHISRSIGDQYGEAHALANLGRVNHSLGEHRLAIQQYSDAEAIFDKLGLLADKGKALICISVALYALGDFPAANSAAESALQVLGKGGSSGISVLEEISRRLEEAEAAGQTVK